MRGEIIFYYQYTLYFIRACIMKYDTISEVLVYDILLCDTK